MALCQKGLVGARCCGQLRGVRFRFRVLGSGSSGNATLVEGGGTRILIDAGLGPRELAERLQSAGVDPASLDLVLLSHEHGDHARGAASFSRKWGVRLSGTRGTYAAAGLGATEIAGYDVLAGGATREIGALSVAAVPVAHDAAEPIAFVVSCGGRSLGHATDLGHLGRPFTAAFGSCSALLLESNYDPVLLRDGPYPWSLKERILSPLGHLSNGDVGRYLASGLPEACETVVLAHLSRKNNHPDVALMVAETALERSGRDDVRVELTAPDGTSWLDVGPAPARPANAGQMTLF
jgi:phosphoribosyl 1,2-cyclic phosphodiesterase